VNRVNAPDGTPLVFEAYEPAEPSLAALVVPDWHPQPNGIAEAWRAPCVRLCDAGFATYCLELRGHGRSGGKRGHLSRFSQLLGDLQAFRRVIRRRCDVPQVLVGHGFGAVVVLRYLETQPGEPPIAAVVGAPFLAGRTRAAAWKRLAAKLADIWPTLPTGRGARFMTAGARGELQWAQRAVVADYQRIERPILFLLGDQDAVVDNRVTRDLAERLGSCAAVRSFDGVTHDLFAAAPVLSELVEYLQVPRSSDPHPRS
jgi:alpha-beta hydrolase superfamily lysophospholipase